MFSALGSLGNTSAYNTSRPLTITVPRDVPAGRIVVVWFASPSIFDIFTPTNGHNWSRCDDSQGNIYSTISAVTDTNSFYGSGCLLTLFMTQLTRDLEGGVDTITAGPHSAHQPGVNWARAISVEEFEIDDGFRPALPHQGWTIDESRGVDPPAMARGFPGPDREILYVHGLASEGPITDVFTWDADYAQITPDGTNTGTATEDVTLRGGYRIATLSGNADTVDVTSTGTDRNTVQALQTICGVPVPELPFPVTPVLDDANRADENPLDNGTWDTANFAFGSAGARVVSNQFRNTGGSQWLDFMNRCVEVYLDMDTSSNMALYYVLEGASQTATLSGRGAQWAYAGGIGWELGLGAAGIQGFVEVVIYPWFEFGVPGNTGGVATGGVGIGLRRTKFGGAWVSRLFIRRDSGSDYEEIAALYDPAGGSLPEGGRIGFAINDGGSGLGHGDNFGGGEIPCGAPFVPQVYRRQFGVA